MRELQNLIDTRHGLGVAALAKQVDAVGGCVAPTPCNRPVSRVLGTENLARLYLAYSKAANCPLRCAALAVGRSVGYQLRLPVACTPRRGATRTVRSRR